MLTQCTNCPFNIYPQIPPTTTFNSELAIVGMNPGNQELISKRPFVGPSSQLLKETLEKSGLPTDPFITNAILCMPPKDVALQKFAIDNCRARVFDELRQVKPKLILAFGNIALECLTNDRKLKIGSCHSKPIQNELGLIIPIYHPGAIIKNVKNYKTFLNGFLYAKQLLDGSGEKDPGKTEYRIVNNFNTEQFKSDMDFLLNYTGVISCDIETTSLNPRIAEILVVAFGIAKNKVLIFPPSELKAIKFILENTKAKVVYQRGQYDTSVLSYNGIETEIHHDTLLEHYCLDENTSGHDLKTLARLFLGATQYDENIDKSKLAELPLEELYQYVAHDADYTAQLHTLFMQSIEQYSTLNKLYHQILIPSINFLRRTSQRGSYIDLDYLRKIKAEIEVELNILRTDATNAFSSMWDRERFLKETGAKSAPIELNINSSDQKRWIIFNRMNIKPRIMRKTDSGKWSVGREILESIEPMPRSIDLLLQYSKLHKLYSTYVVGIEKVVDENSRLHSDLSLQTTVTGRLSSSKPNVQNIPRDKRIKGIFAAPPNRLLLEADFKGIELRVWAHLSNDPYLLKIFNEGRDLHDEMSIEIFGTSFTKEQRVAVKGVNFGAIYGRTAYSIAEEFNIPIWRAQQLIDKLFELAPIGKQYLDSLAEKLKSGEPLVTPFGRERRYGIIIGDQHQMNEAKNFPIQSTASDLNLLAGVELEEPLKGFNAFVDNIIHDAIKIEMPNDFNVVCSIIDLVNTTMTDIPKRWLEPKIDFPVEISIGHRWGYLKEVDIETKEFIDK